MVEHYLPKYGEPYSGEAIAEEAIPFYRFCKPGTATGKILKGTANATTIVGVSVPDELMFTLGATNGSRTVRTGFPIYQPVSIHATGVAYVEVGSGGVTAGNQVASDSTGRAVVYTAPTISTSPAKAEVESVRDAHLIIQGTVLETGAEGAIVKINLDRR